MAPILEEMERRIVEEVAGVSGESPTHVNDLHCGLYDERRKVRGLNEVERREQMKEPLDQVFAVLKEVAME